MTIKNAICNHIITVGQKGGVDNGIKENLFKMFAFKLNIYSRNKKS